MSGFETTRAVLRAHDSAAARSATATQYVLVMVDLSRFSECAATMHAPEIFGLLDLYYAESLTLAATHGGVIKKRIGDAIIVAFPVGGGGRAPAVGAALAFSEALIRLISERFQGEIGAKAAMAAGILSEGTFADGHVDLAGNALTTLFRLEACARQGTLLMPSALYDDARGEAEPRDPGLIRSMRLRLKGMSEQSFTEVVVERAAPHPEASVALAEAATEAIRSADAHASRLGAFALALVGLTYRQGGDAFERGADDGTWLLLLLFLVALGTTLAVSVAVLWPRTDPGRYVQRAPGEWSPTFFGDVPADYETFRRRSVTRSVLEADRARQAFIVARIAQQKARLLRFGALFFGVTLATLVLLVVKASGA